MQIRTKTKTVGRELDPRDHPCCGRLDCSPSRRPSPVYIYQLAALPPSLTTSVNPILVPILGDRLSPARVILTLPAIPCSRTRWSHATHVLQSLSFSINLFPIPIPTLVHPAYFHRNTTTGIEVSTPSVPPVAGTTQPRCSTATKVRSHPTHPTRTTTPKALRD